jgi:hypothetical protein
MVAGELLKHPPIDLRSYVVAGHRIVHTQRLARALLNQGTHLAESPQKPHRYRYSVR